MTLGRFAVCAMVLLSAACGGFGGATPSPATSAPPVPPQVIAPPPPGLGRVLEAHRIAGVTALVRTSFPERSESCFQSGPVVNSRSLDARYFATGDADRILGFYGFVAGFGQCQKDAANFATLTLVVEVSDPASAAEAASRLLPATGPPHIRLPASGTSAVVEPTTPIDGKPQAEKAQGWLAVGRMLAYVYHEAPTGQAAAGADRVLVDQAGLLQPFTPTPQSDVPALPADPMGLEKLAVTPPGEPDLTTGPYDLDGYLRLAIDPAREREILSTNGFVGYYAKHSFADKLGYAVDLYTFQTSAQTNVVYTTFADLEQHAFAGKKFTLPAVPDAPCFMFSPQGFGGDPSFYQRCYVGRGSHLVGVDVVGLSKPDDFTAMNKLLPAQRDLISG